MYARCTTHVALVALLAAPLLAQKTETLMLSGADKDHTVPWEFRISGGMNAGRWTTIPVPSNWELQGFGTYGYQRDPESPDRGEYRHHFQVPATWRGKAVRLVFEGAMTDASVKVNGTSAGPTHQGGHYRFSYDVSALLKYGEDNVLEAAVDEHSADESVNRAERGGDFWLFGGIFRPVYLEAMPERHIARTAIDARADGSLRVDAFVASRAGVPSGTQVTAQVVTLDGHPFGAPFSAVVAGNDTVATLRTKLSGARLWTPETPNRYRVRISLPGAQGHTVTETFGFRTVEVRPQDGIYVNGAKVRLKGVNRHTFWPEAGRASSRAISELDVNLMKDMNMNAVRMSHYPPDVHFLDVADSLGLFVLDELTGWQRAYDTPVGRKLVRETVTRDVNHPSIIFWDNGNEGGWNFDLDADFAKWDPQGRAVLHPWTLHGGVETAHYRPLACCAGRVFQGRDIVMPTELQHGLYDGGHGAGLADYWAAMLANPRGAGMFLWDLVDQGVKRTDLSRDTLDAAGNRGADGIVGPHREKEASFFAIKKIWSPVHLELGDVETLSPTFDGRFVVENRYDFANLSGVRFTWQLVRFPTSASKQSGHTVVARGTAASPNVAAGMRGVVALSMPRDRSSADALYLTATDAHGREIYTWTWMLAAPRAMAERVTSTAPSQRVVTATETSDRLSLVSGDARVDFDRATGRLTRLQRGAEIVPLTNGPRIVGGVDGKLTALTHRADGADHIVEATYEGGLRTVRWRMRPDGWLRLDYQYDVNGDVDAAGVTFDFPEASVTGLRWLGKGPYRVWKNRAEGQEYDVWHKAYNDAVTGVVWQYPEFKGFHGGIHWAVLETRSAPLTIATPETDMFLRVFTPRQPPAADQGRVGGTGAPLNTSPEFPAGDISFLHAIPAIGNKFMPAERVSPAGRKNMVQRNARGSDVPDYSATVWIYSGDPKTLTP
ncbi:MAG: glycoside hydrolase family 2 TIM barrel-domain containing protein [Gemmatimonadota bacterium]